MTRKEAVELLPFIKAFSEGKVIQISNERGEWEDLTEREGLPIGTLRAEPNSFRIKPEPKYRPFANAEECWKEMLKHQPFGWVKYQCSFFYIIYIEDKMMGYGSACGTILHDNFKDTLKGLTFVDGTPFGVKVDEED